MEHLTAANILAGVAVLWVVVQIYNAVMQAVKNHREFKRAENKPVDDLNEGRESCMRKFAADQQQLKRHSEDISDLQGGQQALLIGTRALLNHAIHNGNKDEMIEANRTIDKWLVER